MSNSEKRYFGSPTAGMCVVCNHHYNETIKHHISYFPQKTVLVCDKCHKLIHTTDNYPELKPPKGDAEIFNSQKNVKHRRRCKNEYLSQEEKIKKIRMKFSGDTKRQRLLKGCIEIEKQRNPIGFEQTENYMELNKMLENTNRARENKMRKRIQQVIDDDNIFKQREVTI